MESVTIRPAKVEDIQAIQAVGRQAWYATYGSYRPHEYIESVLANWWSPEATQQALNNPAALTLVAEWNGQVIGTLAGSLTPDDENCVHLYRMYLVPEYLRRGIGRQLWDYYRAALLPDTKCIETSVDQQNEPAQAFYRSLGFVETQQQTLDTFGHLLEVVVMRLQLMDKA